MPDEKRQLTEHEIEDIAERAAEKNARKIFQNLGVDIEDQKSLNRFRADLVHAHKMRRWTEGTAARMWMVLLAVVTLGLVKFIWDAIQAGLGKSPPPP